MEDPIFLELGHAWERHRRWLKAQAVQYEEGLTQCLDLSGGSPIDRSSEIAQEIRHQANSLQAVMVAYERLIAKRRTQ